MGRCVLPLSSVLLSTAVWTATPTQADLWSGFYASSVVPRPVETPGQHETSCIAAIINAQKVHSIPDNLLLSIGIQEAGRSIDGQITVWPWSVNAEGKGMFFNTQAQAIDWVKSQQAQGVRSIDVGCMQINLFWHKGAFSSLEEAFDPTANAQYAARFLTQLKRSEGSWWRAAGSYHSRTDEYRERYLASLAKNQNIANTHYHQLVAAAQDDRPSVANSPANRLPMPPVLWGDNQNDPSAFSIYSRKPLTPILPEYSENDG